jgi:hypothetical protein
MEELFAILPIFLFRAISSADGAIPKKKYSYFGKKLNSHAGLWRQLPA